MNAEQLKYRDTARMWEEKARQHEQAASNESNLSHRQWLKEEAIKCRGFAKDAMDLANDRGF